MKTYFVGTAFLSSLDSFSRKDVAAYKQAGSPEDVAPKKVDEALFEKKRMGSRLWNRRKERNFFGEVSTWVYCKLVQEDLYDIFETQTVNQ